jgi:hypothetical protein
VSPTPGQRVDAVMAAMPLKRYTDPDMLPIVTPWSSSDFQRFLWQDIFGEAPPAGTRTEAMKLPPIARSRNLLCSTITRLPMRELAGQTPTAEQPAWLTQTGDGSSPQLRTVWTVDDLIFYGWSCWWATRERGELVAAARLNQEDWSINADMQVEVDGTVVRDTSQIIVIPGLHEGILSYGADTIEDVRALYKIVKARLLNPVPQIDLHQTEGDPLDVDEIDALIDRWAAARQGRNGGVGYSSPTIEARELGAGGDAQLMIEARNAAAVDLCRLVGVTASRVDASGAGASLTYETTTGRNQELVDFDLALYMTPMSARLSLDDVTAPGRRVDFDLADFTAQAPSITGPDLKD